MAFGEDLKRAGLPEVKRKLLADTVSHATSGAPVVRRQIEQWQIVWS